jgi:DNA-binding MarR family transcriptional regulator
MGPQMDRSTVTRAVQVLERSGFVRKAVDPADRRLLSLTLTPKGKKLIDKLLPLAINFQKKLIDELGPQDAAALERILSKLHQFLARTAKSDEIKSSAREAKL